MYLITNGSPCRREKNVLKFMTAYNPNRGSFIENFEPLAGSNGISSKELIVPFL